MSVEPFSHVMNIKQFQ